MDDVVLCNTLIERNLLTLIKALKNRISRTHFDFKLQGLFGKMAKVTLYDLPSKNPCRTWSLNPWKTRLLLNYKEIEYDTEWIEYPDIAPKFKALSVLTT